mgnify:CR=1 FL=1
MEILAPFLSAAGLISFGTLTALEIVLGIDNVIFISILAGRLRGEDREKARRYGLAGAFVMRLGLLFLVSWIAQLTEPLFSVLGRDFSGKSLILFGGGLFLLFKATREIHHKLEGPDQNPSLQTTATATLSGVVMQILLLDLVFSLDSVITAVGMAQAVSIMIAANVVALVVMLAGARAISAFIDEHPTFKMLALSFLMMIGLVLSAEGLGFHIPKGYVYFAMAFSVVTEFLNLKMKKAGAKPVQLKP